MQFVDEHGFDQRVETVYAYVDFLRSSAGLSEQPPIDLHRIFNHFDMPPPLAATLDGQQGLLIGEDDPVILINKEDSRRRQRFSTAHELLECLFATLKIRQSFTGLGAGSFNHLTKEKLCNLGAAELLMPSKTFCAIAVKSGLNFDSAKRLADLFDVSLQASLFRIAECSGQDCAIVLFRRMLSPNEMRAKAAEQIQFTLLETPRNPVIKMRVEWSKSFGRMPMIPKYKSVSQQSLIERAHQTGDFAAGLELLNLSGDSHKYRCEHYPFLGRNEERCVLSLLIRQ